MSFGEVYASSGPQKEERSSLSVSLSQGVAQLRQETAALRRRGGPEGGELLRLAQTEAALRREFELQMRQLQNTQRAAAASKRVALSKLERELDAARRELHECRASIATRSSAAEPSAQRSADAPVGGLSALQLEEKVEAVDEFEQERLLEMRRIHQDLRLVNEMFKDVAEIIRSQDAPIQEIEQSTERAHDRVEEGLRQIQIAADTQPAACRLS